jgi:hypothetical protein
MNHGLQLLLLFESDQNNTTNNKIYNKTNEI